VTAVTRAAPRGVDERAAAGRAARTAAPWSVHCEWTPSAGREDPVAILERQAETRVGELIPIRYGRMLRSPFAFFRGAAAVMAADLAGRPSPGLGVQLCGDAHLSNFGMFAGPDRRLVFDLNDFDETLPGPFEWDVLRFAASVEIAARHRGFGAGVRRRAVRAAVRSYRESMRRLAELRTVEVWYARHDVDEMLADHRSRASAEEARELDRRLAKTRAKDSLRALDKLTEAVDGTRRFIHDPPLLVPLSELLADGELKGTEKRLRAMLRGYRTSISAAQRVLLDRFAFTDMAHRVVGVGSVGTRAWVVLLLGRDEHDPLVLQIKEAQPSVLEPHLGASAYRHHGRRVVEGQHLMQAASDVFLGWLAGEGLDGVRRDFYVRQLWDGKGSADLERMPADRFAIYAQLCGTALARAHARSGDPVALAAYLGSGDSFDRAMTAFADRYADQNAEDFSALEAAADAGRIPAEDAR
jgi:uncharacterized protein (DUF2252 family)